MNRYRTIGRLLAVLAAVGLGKGCGDGDSPAAPPTAESFRPTTVTVTSAPAELTAVGATARLTAEARDRNGNAMAGAAITWTTSDTLAVQVDAAGLVTAAGQGAATITATAGSASGSAVVTVTQTVASVVVGPPIATITSPGDTLRLTALAFDENGYAVAGAEFSWESSSAGVATVDVGGLVTAVAEGTVTITANVEGLSGSAEIKVTEISGTGTDRDILVALYKAMDGPGWKNAANWLTDAPLGDWYGVETDSRGRVIRLSLPDNDLTGAILPELGNLTNLRELILPWNSLTGEIPAELGSLTNLEDLNLRQCRLTGQIPPELGNLTKLRGLNLGDNRLSGSIPPELGNLTDLTGLNLPGNDLTGPMPPELGNLTRLGELNLDRNDLTGLMPPEFGNLMRLESLVLNSNHLTGPIPPELGSLLRLRALRLEANALTGPIPSELGNLARLRELRLDGNNFTGPIPPELGNLARLTQLPLEGNALTGPVPSELGNLAQLTELNLSGNSGMTGSLPTELAGLDRLETLLATGTDLCAPSDPGFQAWLEAIYRLRVATCASDGTSFAYLITQAVQSRKHPVPLVAGRQALLRVFVTAASPTTAVIPPVRARFYVDGTEIHIANATARTATIPTEVDEGDLSRSSNVEIPAHIVRPGLEMVIEIDPEGTLDPGLGVAKRIPETGRVAVDAREMPVLHLTVIPFLWDVDPHWEVVETVAAMEADPEGHELLWHTRSLLPIGDFEVTAHAPVLTSTSYAEWFPILDQTAAIRAIEGGIGHYMGTMSRPGLEGRAGSAYLRGKVFISRLNPTTIAHELGHNLSLYHAPCGGARGSDPGFPTPDGSIGTWGYDFRHGGALASPGRADLMSYCEGWISDYHFTNALRFRLIDEQPPAAASRNPRPAVETESVLLWGGMSAEGEPYLNPSFVVDAPPLLPNATGEHRITGRSDTGNELFSLSFDLPEVADGDGSSSFAFVLPVEPDWAGSLAGITLSGPGGSATLDGNTHRPMSILLDPNTGQVRGILRDLPPATQTARDVVGGSSNGAGFEVLFSRGIPDAGAWGR